MRTSAPASVHSVDAVPARRMAPCGKSLRRVFVAVLGVDGLATVEMNDVAIRHARPGSRTLTRCISILLSRVIPHCTVSE